MDYLFPLEEAPSLEVVGLQPRFPVRRIYCVGRNYAAHAREMGADPEREPPFFFCKPASALVSDGGAVAYPAMTRELHHEVELVVALGEPASEIPVEAAARCVFGYAVGIDLTRRDLQEEAKKLGRPWDTAKGFDQSAPVSGIVPVTDCGYLQEGEISLYVDGNLRQRGDLSQMIWSVAEVISGLSRYFRLFPGDLVFTGTPAGVGAVRRGEVLEGRIEGVGRLVTPVQ